jgi:GTPase
VSTYIHRLLGRGGGEVTNLDDDGKLLGLQPHKFSASTEYLKTLSVAKIKWIRWRTQVDRYRQG